MMNMTDSMDNDYVIRARGLPWACTEVEVKNFLSGENENGCHVNDIVSVNFTYNREGRPSGEAYIEFRTENSFNAALRKDHEKMGHRYIEIFSSKRAEMDRVLKVRGKPRIAAAGNDEAVVRLRGLPFGCTKEEIANFFSGLEVVPNGITILEGSGRASGEAFVHFTDPDTAEKALEKHMQHIAHRYIEVFRSSREELSNVTRRMGSFGRDSSASLAPTSWSSWSGASSYSRYGMPPRPGPYDRPGPGNGAASYRNGMPGGLGWGGGGYGPMSGGGGSWSMGAYGGYGGGTGGGPGPLNSIWGGSDMYGSNKGGWGGIQRVGASGGGPIRPTGGRGSRAMGGGRPLGAQGGSDSFGGGNCFLVKMRGLPFSANESDIAEFFKPLRLAGVEMLKEFRTNRPSGEAKVAFYALKDAQQAMKKDRAHMGTRYIELFLEGGPSDGSIGGSYTDFTSDALRQKDVKEECVKKERYV